MLSVFKDDECVGWCDN